MRTEVNNRKREEVEELVARAAGLTRLPTGGAKRITPGLLCCNTTKDDDAKHLYSSISGLDEASALSCG